MKTRLKVILLISHLAVLGAGTGTIYLLPILTARGKCFAERNQRCAEAGKI